MKHNIDTHKYMVYQLRGKDARYVAIPYEYELSILQLVADYGSLQKIPNDKTIRGIFLTYKEKELTLDENAQQNDITVSQLRTECCAEFMNYNTL